MEQEELDRVELREPFPPEAHPWLSEATMGGDDDTVGEVIRYTLDELRLA